jgi:hypothetical protein
LLQRRHPQKASAVYGTALTAVTTKPFVEALQLLKIEEESPDMDGLFKIPGPEMNLMAVEALCYASTTLGLDERTEPSISEMYALARLARARARELWQRLPAPRPALLALLARVEMFTFFNEAFETDLIDEEWFSKNSHRKFRARMPLPHEAFEQRISLSEGYRATTIVVKGNRDNPEDRGNNRCVVCFTRKGYRFDSLNDEAIRGVLNCSTAAVWS